MPIPPAELESLLEYLKQTRGFDFTGYKRSTLERRISKRMEEVDVDTADQYRDYLEVHPHEFGFLFDTMLINVTSFFRDEPAWMSNSRLVMEDEFQRIETYDVGDAAGADWFGRDIQDVKTEQVSETNTGQFVNALDVARFLPLEQFGA